MVDTTPTYWRSSMWSGSDGKAQLLEANGNDSAVVETTEGKGSRGTESEAKRAKRKGSFDSELRAATSAPKGVESRYSNRQRIDSGMESRPRFGPESTSISTPNDVGSSQQTVDSSLRQPLSAGGQGLPATMPVPATKPVPATMPVPAPMPVPATMPVPALQAQSARMHVLLAARDNTQSTLVRELSSTQMHGGTISALRRPFPPTDVMALRGAELGNSLIRYQQALGQPSLGTGALHTPALGPLMVSEIQPAAIQQQRSIGLGIASARGLSPLIDSTFLSRESPLNRRIAQQAAGQFNPLISDIIRPNNSLNVGRAAHSSLQHAALLGNQPTTADLILAQHTQATEALLQHRATQIHNFTKRDEAGIPLDLPIILALPDDYLKLSSHQVLLRQQIEAFRASEEDISTHKRGRNKPVLLKQIGIRCIHCAHLPVRKRQKGSTYFPAAMLGLYQAAQNMSTTHMQCGLCSEMPNSIKQQFAHLISTKVASSGAGRPYWAKAAKKLGLVDTDDGIRFIRDLPEKSDGEQAEPKQS